MAKVSKRYAAAKDQIDRSKVYTVEEAVDLAKKPAPLNSTKQLKYLST